MGRLVLGVGINDWPTPVTFEVGGQRKVCPYYSRWKAMLARCYSRSVQERQPTYAGCSVVPEWHLFSNFRGWMETQDWEGNSLDKDILFPGNKVYGPSTCVFVTSETNQFFGDSAANRGEFPIGVSTFSRDGKYRAECGGVWLGLFESPDEAHAAWQKEKERQARQLANKQKDPRVAGAILSRFT